jgi:hypothetical protein
MQASPAGTCKPAELVEEAMTRPAEHCGAVTRVAELDAIISGRGLTFEPATIVGEQRPPPQPFRPEPPDWEQERLERLAAEREARGDPGEQCEEEPAAHPRARRWPKDAA